MNMKKLLDWINLQRALLGVRYSPYIFKGDLNMSHLQRFDVLLTGIAKVFALFFLCSMSFFAGFHYYPSTLTPGLQKQIQVERDAQIRELNAIAEHNK